MLDERWLAALTELLDAEIGVSERQRLLADAPELSGASETGDGTGESIAQWFAGFAARLGDYHDQERIRQIMQRCCPCSAPAMFAAVKAIWAECYSVSQFAVELERRRPFGKSIVWRDGQIVVAKPPICACDPEYQHIHGGRYAATCHCDMASRLAGPVPDTFCACGGGFYRKLFREIWGVEVRVDTVSTVVSGGSECVFAIHPPEVLGRTGIQSS